MYQFSRGMYRELSVLVDSHAPQDAAYRILLACESTIERLVTDRQYFARPTRTLFLEIRRFFPLQIQSTVLMIISSYISAAESWLDEQPKGLTDVLGSPPRCRATTRRGTPCARTPQPGSDYCPSHRHLAATEHAEVKTSGELSSSTLETV